MKRFTGYNIYLRHPDEYARFWVGHCYSTNIGLVEAIAIAREGIPLGATLYPWSKYVYQDDLVIEYEKTYLGQ
jgi:hypothetical protein